MSRPPPIGIDLGTTKCAVSVHLNGICEVIPNTNGDRTTPSFVYYNPNSSEVVVGKSAQNQGALHVNNFIFDVKRLMGRTYDDAYVKQLRSRGNFPYTLAKGPNGQVEVEVQHNGQQVRKTPEEISADILKYLKKTANRHLNVEVTEAVISVPAHFSNSQRKATKKAAELAGLTVLKLISEPVAAAVYYASKNAFKKAANLLVFDFGGGTLDVSIIEVNKNVFEVKAVDGDTFLGGRDIDENLVKHFKGVLTRDFGPRAITPRLIRRVENVCVDLKLLLTDTKEALKVLSYVCGDNDVSFTLNKGDFEQLNKELFTKAINLVDRCIRDSGLTKVNISNVVLVGGSSRIPKMRELLGKYFGIQKIRNMNPDESVALGAGIQAALLKNSYKDLERFQITEVTPLTVGTDVGRRSLMSPLIKKNSKLPVKSKSRLYSTLENDQKAVNFDVYEGERKRCEFNNLLGSFEIGNLPPGMAGDVVVEVTCSLNEDGILEVEARDRYATQTEKLTISVGEYRLRSYDTERSIQDAERNREEDRVFEEFCNYLDKIDTVCQHVMYHMHKIPQEDDRNFVTLKCEKFMEAIESTDHTEIEVLREAYVEFKVVAPIINEVANVQFLQDDGYIQAFMNFFRLT